MSIRTEKVSSIIKKDIAEIIEREFSGTSVGFITVTDVQMTPDLKTAKIYVSILGSEELRKKTMLSLENNKKHIRQMVGSHMRMKFTPSVEFFLDDSLDKMERIETILKKIHEDDKPNS